MADSTYIHGSDPEEQVRLSLLNGLLNSRSIRALRLQPGDRVLDIGSGLGQLTRAMAREVGAGGRVVGIERDPAQLEAARREAEAHGEADRVEFRLGSAESPPLDRDERGTFDVAHARFVLEHVTDPGRVVAAMVAAVRPGGRVVVEDDDHDILRLWPPEPRIEALWHAYAHSYRHLGNDPYVGRRLVALLRQAGAEPRRTDMLFFGAAAGGAVFEAMIDNFLGVVAGARATILASGALDAEAVDAGLAAFDTWRRHPDASLWYAVCWAYGLRPGAGETSDPPPPVAGRRRGSGTEATLDFLVDSARDLASTLRLEEVLERIARRVQTLLDAHLFCVMLWNEEAGLLEHTYSLKFGQHIPQRGGFALGEGLSGSAAAELRPLRVADVSADPRYVRFRHAEVEVRSELAVPLVSDGRLVGVLDLESTQLDAFTHEHEQVLWALASHMAAALENARLYGEVRSSQRRLEEELETARRIQSGLLPKRSPRIPGLDLGVARRAARELSGDFYDLLATPGGGLAFALGDVAGKGTGAALLASLAVGALRGELLARRLPPQEILRRLNDHFHGLALEHRFVALLLGSFEPPARLVVSSAGIPPPIRLRGGRAESFDLAGVPLGGLADQTYAALALDLAPGDRYLFFTDGVEEAGGDEPLGSAGLARHALAHSHLDAQALAGEILAAAERLGQVGEADDRTVVILGVAGG